MSVDYRALQTAATEANTAASNFIAAVDKTVRDMQELSEQAQAVQDVIDKKNTQLIWMLDSIKQADANLLAYPLDVITDRAQIEKDLHYYEPRFSASGPAMGYAVLATLYARLGNSEKAHSIFVKSYRPNEVPPFGVISETAGGTNPYFSTGAGGMLQSVIFGFGGLSIRNDGIQQQQIKLPKGWKSLLMKGIGPGKKEYSIR